MTQNSLFTDHLNVKPHQEFSTILPISVIDIAAQGRRPKQNHDAVSSRENYSPFPVEIATLCAELFLRSATVVFDPFAGWGERGNAITAAGKRYIGYDSSSEAVARTFTDYGITTQVADSRIAPIPSFNGLLTCPPYWNLERYESLNGLDRDRTWEKFLLSLRIIFMRCWDAADIGATFCVMVGDWRKNHIYYDLEFHVSLMFKEFGANIVDKLIVSRSKISKIKIMLPQAKRLGYSVRVHENLLVFRKG